MVFDQLRPIAPEVPISESHINAVYLATLASMGGTAYQLGDMTVDRDVLRRLYDVLGHVQSIDMSAYEQYVAPDGLSPRADQEHIQIFFQAAEGLLDLRTATYSYGVAAPTVLSMLQRQQQQTIGDGTDYRALLVGALSPQTVYEFDAAIRMYFPEGERIITDPEGIRTVDAAKMMGVQFHNRNFLANQIPSEIGQVDSIHTNALLHMLEGESTLSAFRDNKRRFFIRAGEVLRPGGRLMMVEKTNRHDAEKDARRMVRMLEQEGYMDIDVCPAEVFDRRRDVERFFLSGGRDINYGRIIQSPHLLQISAQKPI